MSWNPDFFDVFFICLLLALFAGSLCDIAINRTLRQSTPKTAILTMTVTAVFLCVYGFTLMALRCILLCQILMVAGVFDFVTYEIPDYLHLLVAMVGVIYIYLPSAFLGFLIVPLPFLIAALKTDKIGGGDVKLMMASGFALGVTSGIWMMIWGLAAALLWNRVFCREQKRLPLAPFLAFGTFLTLFPI